MLPLFRVVHRTVLSADLSPQSPVLRYLEGGEEVQGTGEAVKTQCGVTRAPVTVPPLLGFVSLYSNAKRAIDRRQFLEQKIGNEWLPPVLCDGDPSAAAAEELDSVDAILGPLLGETSIIDGADTSRFAWQQASQYLELRDCIPWSDDWADRVRIAPARTELLPVEYTRPRQGTNKPQLPQGQPRQLDLYIRPYRYFPEDALEHGEDLFQSANATPPMKNAGAVFLGSDNGPGYGLREMMVLHLNWRLARENLWAHIVRGSQAPDHSAWHWQSEQPFSVVRRAVVGHLFGRSWCNGDPVDQPLPMKDIVEKTTEAATKEYVQLLHDVADQEELCVSCTYHCTLCTKCCSCDISQIVISNVGFARTSRGMSSAGTPQTRHVSSPTVVTLWIITYAPTYDKCGNHGSHDCVENLWTWASTSLLSGFHMWSAIGAWTRRRRAWSAKPVWPPNARKNLTSL